MIHISALSKSYAHTRALHNVDLHIQKGEIFGLLGPNGAGKSTCINILNGLLKSGSGTVTINGLDIKNLKAKQYIGVVPQDIALYQELSAFDNLMFWGSLYKIPKNILIERVLSVLKLVGLEGRKKDVIKSYSGGMKRRINIAAALLHRPKVLLMDEPTVGVDPQSRNYVFEIIERLNREGMTIVYTTHYMEEVERLCNRIAIMDSGEIIATGNLQELKEQARVKDLIEIILQGPLEEINNIKKHLSNNITIYENQRILIESDALGDDITAIINRIQTTKGIIKNIHTQEANLESVFLKLTGKKLRN